MSRAHKILIMGLPGAGKTTLATALAPMIGAVHFNADELRAEINKDLGFTVEDRVEQARRMGWLCDKVWDAGHNVIADFVCPTTEAREVFSPRHNTFMVWIDRIQEGRFEDTNRLFEAPEFAHVRVVANGSVDEWSRYVIQVLADFYPPV